MGDPLQRVPMLACVNTKFRAATFTPLLKLMKSANEMAMKRCFYFSDDATVEYFGVEMLVNGEWLQMQYIPKCGVWMVPYGKLAGDSEFTLRIEHGLTKEKWTLQSVRGAFMFHRETLSVVDSPIVSDVCIAYKIVPYSGGLEVTIVGGAGNNWQPKPSSTRKELFDFLLPMKQTHDGHNTLMPCHELTSLMIEKLQFFAIVIVDGMAQSMQRAQHRYGNGMYLEVAAEELRRTASVSVIFYLKIPNSKKLFPLTFANIWKQERLTFDVTIDPKNIHPETGTIGCNLDIGCKGVDSIDMHWIATTLSRMR